MSEMDDRELQHDIVEEPEWAPHLDASDVTVAVADGIVRLRGFVANLAEKTAAERAVWRVRGVCGLAQELKVQMLEARRISGDECAHGVLSVLRWATLIPGEHIQVKVERGVVTLIGGVDAPFQRTEAEDRVHRLSGVKAVDNRIAVHRSPEWTDIKDQVERAFRRHVRLHASEIAAALDGGRVILTDRVPSLAEREIAGNIAWSTACVAEVENRPAVGI